MPTREQIRMFKPYVNEAAVSNAVEALRSGWIGEGARVEEFEKALCDQFGYRYALGLNSATSGLRLALAMCGVGPGDEVVTTAMTCTATNMPILEQFAVPVFVDVKYNTGNIDPLKIEKCITEKTKAIMCVHWAGYPCDMDEIGQVAARYGVPVIEDAAHALGATYKGAPIGTLSQFTVLS